MTRDEIVTVLSDCCPEALLADGFEDAFVGISRRCGQPTLVVYDYRRGIEVLMKREGMTTEEAEGWMEFNVVEAWAGEQSPIWLVRVR